MLKIYHNNRCRKSREALAMLEEKGLEHEVIDYMNNPLTEDQLENLLDKLEMSPEDLVRVKEADWKENFKGKELDDAEVILAMIEYPKLMERPIIETDEKAVLARPAEKMEEIL
ncbi:MAG: arsenate reductase (glutaredoxin) [Schleiferiaceae bacterium]|nr:arsenate reductase (glutaredoxin) [Schleiferiaceae bacterium]